VDVEAGAGGDRGEKKVERAGGGAVAAALDRLVGDDRLAAVARLDPGSAGEPHLELWLFRGAPVPSNEGSRVLALRWRDQRLLLTGDAEEAGLEALLERQALREPIDDVGDAVSLGLVATGGEGVLGFGAVGLPDGLGIDPVTGVISGAPVTPGVYNVTATVTDTADQSDAETFTWTVNSAPPPACAGLTREAEDAVLTER